MMLESSLPVSIPPVPPLSEWILSTGPGFGPPHRPAFCGVYLFQERRGLGRHYWGMSEDLNVRLSRARSAVYGSHKTSGQPSTREYLARVLRTRRGDIDFYYVAAPSPVVAKAWEAALIERWPSDWNIRR